LQFLFNNRDQDIGGDGAPDLRFYRVFTVAKESLNTQMLLDPFEKQLNLPTAFIQRSNRQRGQHHVIRQKDQCFPRGGIFKADPSQVIGVGLTGVEAIERNALITKHAGRAIRRRRIYSVGIHAAFGSGNEERPGLKGQAIQHTDFVHFAIADVNKGRYITAQIQQRVQFDRRLGLPERCPVKQRQTQINRRRIQGVTRVFQLNAKVVMTVQVTGTTNQQGGDIGQIRRRVLLLSRNHQPTGQPPRRVLGWCTSVVCLPPAPDWSLSQLRAPGLAKI